MIGRGAWLLVFLSWFWIDGGAMDPAWIKDLLLPLALSAVVLSGTARAPLGAATIAGIAFHLWSFHGAYPFESLEAEWFLGTTAFAFLAGASGARPPLALALTATALAIGKGWDDLLLLGNLGGGIPFTTTSFFLHKNLFTLVLSPALLLLLHPILRTGVSLGVRLSAGCLFVSGFLLLLVSDGRGALVGFAIGGLFVLAAWGSRSYRTRWIPWSLAGILILATAWGVHARLPQTVREVASIVEAERVTTAVPARFRQWVWTGSLRLWREAPITGIGLGAYRYRIESVLDPWLDRLRDRRMKVDVAHSHWLQTGVERGMVGLLLEMAVTMLAFAGALRSGRISLAGAILSLSVHGVVAEGMEYSLGAAWWWYLVGLGVSSWRPSRSIDARIPAIAMVLLLAYPFWSQVRTLRGEALLLREPKSTSVPLDLARAADLAPWSPRVLVAVARYQEQSGDRSAARATLERLHESHPWRGATDADLPLARIWLLDGRTDSARALIDDLRALHPNDPSVLQIVALQHHQRGGCEPAKAFIDSVRREYSRLCRPTDLNPPSGKPGWYGRLAPERRRKALEDLADSRWILQAETWRIWAGWRIPGCKP